MANDYDPTALSPTVSQVIDQFAAAMRSDADIPDDAVDRLEALLRTGTVPKANEINAAIFEPPPNGTG